MDTKVKAESERAPMAFKESKRGELLLKYPALKPFLTANRGMVKPASLYQQLDSLHGKISNEAYAHALRRLLKMSTLGVSNELRINMLRKVRQEEFMTKDELAKLVALPGVVTVFRGAAYEEETPGLSWTLDRHIASDKFYEGKLFKAEVPKDEIIAYIADQCEEEILVDVKQFSVVEADDSFGLSSEMEVEIELPSLTLGTHSWSASASMTPLTTCSASSLSSRW